MNDNIVIIRNTIEDYFFSKINFDNKFNMYKYNKFNILIFKICKKYNLPFINLFFGDWKKIKKNIECYIIFDSSYNYRISKCIKKKNPNCKIILYYWNSINNKFYENILKDKNIDEFWTFDKSDALKYNLNYNPQFYIKNVQSTKSNEEIDILFLGRAKDRINKLKYMQEEFSNKKLKNNFIIIEKEKDYIKYDDYLNLVFKSKCILDYNQSSQIGLSLRPMEALFFEKKLITNNKDIINYDFYNSKNIFILGVDNINDVEKFINSDYEKVDENIIDYYTFENWIKRFQKGSL